MRRNTTAATPPSAERVRLGLDDAAVHPRFLVPFPDGRGSVVAYGGDDGVLVSVRFACPALSSSCAAPPKADAARADAQTTRCARGGSGSGSGSGNGNDANGEVVSRVARRFDVPIRSLAVSADGRRVALGFEDGSTTLFAYDEYRIQGDGKDDGGDDWGGSLPARHPFFADEVEEGHYGADDKEHGHDRIARREEGVIHGTKKARTERNDAGADFGDSEDPFAGVLLTQGDEDEDEGEGVGSGDRGGGGTEKDDASGADDRRDDDCTDDYSDALPFTAKRAKHAKAAERRCAGPRFDAPVRSMRFVPDPFYPTCGVAVGKGDGDGDGKGQFRYYLAIATESRPGFCVVDVTNLDQHATNSDGGAMDVTPSSTMGRRYMASLADANHDGGGVRGLSLSRPFFAAGSGGVGNAAAASSTTAATATSILATLGMDGRLCLWSLPLPGRLPPPPSSSDFDPDLEWDLLHRDGYDRRQRGSHAREKTRVVVVPAPDVGEWNGSAPSDRACHPVWSPDGSWLALPGTVDLQLRHRTDVSKERIIRFNGGDMDGGGNDKDHDHDHDSSDREDTIVAIGWSPDSNYVITGGKNGRVCVWEVWGGGGGEGNGGKKDRIYSMDKNLDEDEDAPPGRFLRTLSLSRLDSHVTSDDDEGREHDVGKGVVVPTKCAITDILWSLPKHRNGVGAEEKKHDEVMHLAYEDGTLLTLTRSAVLRCTGVGDVSFSAPTAPLVKRRREKRGRRTADPTATTETTDKKDLVIGRAKLAAKRREEELERRRLEEEREKRRREDDERWMEKARERKKMEFKEKDDEEGDEKKMGEKAKRERRNNYKKVKELRDDDGEEEETSFWGNAMPEEGEEVGDEDDDDDDEEEDENEEENEDQEEYHEEGNEREENEYDNIIEEENIDDGEMDAAPEPDRAKVDADTDADEASILPLSQGTDDGPDTQPSPLPDDADSAVAEEAATPAAVADTESDTDNSPSSIPMSSQKRRLKKKKEVRRGYGGDDDGSSLSDGDEHDDDDLIFDDANSDPKEGGEMIGGAANKVEYGTEVAKRNPFVADEADEANESGDDGDDVGEADDSRLAAEAEEENSANGEVTAAAAKVGDRNQHDDRQADDDHFPVDDGRFEEDGMDEQDDDYEGERRPEVALLQNSDGGRALIPAPPPQQPPFLPSSTPFDSMAPSRILCWNYAGVITLHSPPDDMPGGDNVVDITFSDGAFRRPSTFTDNLGFVMGSLGDDGAVFCTDVAGDDDDDVDDDDVDGVAGLSESTKSHIRRNRRREGGKRSEPTGSKVYFHRFSTFGSIRDKDWVLTLPDEELAVGCASGEGWAAVSTGRRLLRLFTSGGNQTSVTWLRGDAITMAGRGRFLAVFYHESTPLLDGTQRIGYDLLDCSLSSSEGGCGPTVVGSGAVAAISAGSDLKWAGFDENGSLAAMDGEGILSLLVRLGGGGGGSGGGNRGIGGWAWSPVLDTLGHCRSRSDSYWPVTVEGGKLVCVPIRGGESSHPDPARRPVTTTLGLRLPLAPSLGGGGNAKVDAMEEVSVRANLSLRQRKFVTDLVTAGVGSDEAEEEEALRDYDVACTQVDKVTLKLFFAVLRTGKLEKALDLVHRLHLDQSFDIAIRASDRLGHMKLSDRIEGVRERRFPPTVESSPGYEVEDDNVGAHRLGRGEYDRGEPQRVSPTVDGRGKRVRDTDDDDSGVDNDDGSGADKDNHHRYRIKKSRRDSADEEDEQPREPDTPPRSPSHAVASSSSRKSRNPFVKKRLGSPKKSAPSQSNTPSSPLPRLSRTSTFSMLSRERSRVAKRIL